MKNTICICQLVLQDSAMVFHVQTIETENKHSFEIKLDKTKQKETL